MVLFDVKKYETPDAKDVDMEQTKHNVSVFLSAYLAARCRVGQPREPKVTASFSLVPPSTANNTFEAEQMLIQKEEAQEEFEAVVSGNKRFEIRENDRNYKKGDILRLNEYQDGQYTGDVHVAEITYITDYAQQDGYVVLGIK